MNHTEGMESKSEICYEQENSAFAKQQTFRGLLMRHLVVGHATVYFYTRPKCLVLEKMILSTSMYDTINVYLVWAEVNKSIFYFTIFTAKLSIACQNRRMTYLASSSVAGRALDFHHASPRPGTSFSFTEIFKCSPVAMDFSYLRLGQIENPKTIHCLNRTAIGLADRIIHILTDVALFSVPIAIVYRPHIARRSKLRLIAIFAIGGMSTIASKVRNANIVQNRVDFTWGTHLIYIFNIIDISFALVVASLPALNFLVDPAWNRLKSSTGYFSSDRTETDAFRAS